MTNIAIWFEKIFFWKWIIPSNLFKWINSICFIILIKQIILFKECFRIIDFWILFCDLSWLRKVLLCSFSKWIIDSELCDIFYHIFVKFELTWKIESPLKKCNLMKFTALIKIKSKNPFFYCVWYFQNSTYQLNHWIINFCYDISILVLTTGCLP